jgi:CRP-like cAMP-binding protein
MLRLPSLPFCSFRIGDGVTPQRRLEREKRQMVSNGVLSQLPERDRSRIAPLLVPEDLKVGDILIEAYSPLESVWFLNSGIVSNVQLMQDGSMVEAGFVGREGVAGVHAWLGATSVPTRSIVQVPGKALRMTTQDLRQEVRRGDSHLDRLLSHYSSGYLVMVEQTAGCNRLHTVEQRLCRWLALIDDRVDGAAFPMRQEFLAQMLGVQRPTISVAAGALQRQGTIEYRRGMMRVLETPKLRSCACECYEVTSRQFPYLLSSRLAANGSRVMVG